MQPRLVKPEDALLPPRPGAGEIGRIYPLYETMLAKVMEAIADRYERRPGYPFIDTKLDLMTGEDFPDDDPVRGPGAVYGWIQGRGLEALSGHVLWLRRDAAGKEPAGAQGEAWRKALADRLTRIAGEVLERLRELRRLNHGRLFFFMTPSGTPFTLDEDGRPVPHRLDASSPYTFTDLFCAKGIYAAARLVGDESARSEALDYARPVVDAVRERRLVNDQQSLNPANPLERVPGRHSHTPYMLCVGLLALLAEHEREPALVRTGLELIRHVLSHHTSDPDLAGDPRDSSDTRRTNDGRRASIEPHVFWEFVDERGEPYRQGEFLEMNPGHAIEFVGLSLKFIHTVRRFGLDPSTATDLDEVERRLLPVLFTCFRYGFNEAAGGIYVHVDALTKRPVHSQMPWWSLPETMRAAAYAHGAARSDAERADCLAVFARCHNAFVRHYLRPELHYMAVQTRSAEGEPIRAIPATADADPGYHTGLSIIDVLDLFERWRGR